MMPRFHTFFTRCWLLVATTMIVSASCNRDKCVTSNCYNGGACQAGACACASGYEGATCSTLSRIKYMGNHIAFSTVDSAIYVSNVQPDPNSETGLFISNFDNRITGDVSAFVSDSDDLVIPTQDVQGYTVSGTIHYVASKDLNVSYTISSSGMTKISVSTIWQ